MSSEDKYRHYAEKVQLFKGFEPVDVGNILQHGRQFEFPAGKTIFHEGSLGSNLFIVLGGEVDIYKRNQLISRLKVGDAFGEMAVLNHEPRTASAVAHSDVRVFTLDESQINRILEKRIAVKFLLNIIHVLSARLEETTTKMATNAR